VSSRLSATHRGPGHRCPGSRPSWPFASPSERLAPTRPSYALSRGFQPPPLRFVSYRPSVDIPCSVRGPDRLAPIFGDGATSPTTRSALVVSHHLDGLFRCTAAGLLHPAADPGVHRVSTPTDLPCRRATGASPRRERPLEELPSPAGGPASPRDRCPLAVARLESTATRRLEAPQRRVSDTGGTDSAELGFEALLRRWVRLTDDPLRDRPATCPSLGFLSPSRPTVAPPRDVCRSFRPRHPSVRSPAACDCGSSAPSVGSRRR